MSNAISKSRSKSHFVDSERVVEIETLTKKVFGTRPDRVAFPGGSSRTAFLAQMGEEIFVLAKRDNEADTIAESMVLKVLSKTGYVPKFIARQGRWLVQEWIPGQRLPVALDVADVSTRFDMAQQALSSLSAIQEAAHAEGLQHRMPRIGVKPGWNEDRAGEAIAASKLLGIDPPRIDVDAILAAMDVGFHDFIKWDSRPGNAMFNNGHITWFDWEDCGRRCALDDLVCFICDEWLALPDDMENVLLDRWLKPFSGRLSEDEARRYFDIAAVVHLTFRLRLIVKHKLSEDGWWNREKCLAGDKVGVTRQEAERLCRRVVRYAYRDPLTSGYQDWVGKIAVSLKLDRDEIFQSCLQNG